MFDFLKNCSKLNIVTQLEKITNTIKNFFFISTKEKTLP